MKGEGDKEGYFLIFLDKFLLVAAHNCFHIKVNSLCWPYVLLFKYMKGEGDKGYFSRIECTPE